MPSGRQHMRTITLAEVREINRSSILELIRRENPISRAQISEDLGVSLASVIRIVDELMEEGLVIEDAKKEWSGGRKRTRVCFNGTQHLVVGVDLGGTDIYGAVADFNGNVLYEIRHENRETESEGNFELLCSVVDQALAFAQTTSFTVKGIGIGVPGIIVPETGVISIAPALAWNDFPLKERLLKRYPIPITIENDVNLAALGEIWFGSDEEISNLVLLTIGTGIGAGIVINGAVYHGKRNMAGEVGYFLPDRSYLGRQFNGFGALEQLASSHGIAERAREVLHGMRPEEELQALTAQKVLDAFRHGTDWGDIVMKDTLDYLALLITAIATILDPDVILLGGGISSSAEFLIQPIQDRLHGVLPRMPVIRPSKLGDQAAIMGAIAQLLRITSNYYLLQKIE